MTPDDAHPHGREGKTASPLPTRPVSPRDWKLNLLTLGAFCGILLIAGFLMSQFLGPAGMITGVVLVGAMCLFILVRWHASVTAYRCPSCAHEFVISPLTDFLSPHLLSVKYLRCPSCRVRGWATIRMRGPST
jgi:DNA-directed RNA polymerase subunit RPC12/RpoP